MMTEDFSQTHRRCKVVGYCLLVACLVLTVHGSIWNITRYVHDRILAQFFEEEDSTKAEGYLNRGADCIAATFTLIIYYFSTTEYGNYHVRFIKSLFLEDALPKWILTCLLRAVALFLVIRLLMYIMFSI